MYIFIENIRPIFKNHKSPLGSLISYLEFSLIHFTNLSSWILLAFNLNLTKSRFPFSPL